MRLEIDALTLMTRGMRPRVTWAGLPSVQPGHDTRRRPFATVVGLLVVVVLNMLMSVSRVMNFPGS